MTKLSFAERAKLCDNSTAKKLFRIMADKQSNLALSADVTSSQELLTLVEAVSEEICLLKTHIDIIEDFTPELTQQLKQLADKHQFLIFEDRKFADIGNTVKQQYEKGIYHIADWADIINAHLLPGEGIIKGLKQIGLPAKQGLLLIAQMSSRGNLLTQAYQQASIEAAKKHRDFVIGFICQEQLIDDPQLIHMTPGVQLETNHDDLGQNYLTPEYVIQEKGSDLVIVGRGIYQAVNPQAAAKLYRKRAWEAYWI